MRYETTVSGGRHELRGLLRPCGEKRFGGAGCQRCAGKSACRQHGGRVRRKRVRRTDDYKGGRVWRLHGCGGRRQADIGSGAKPAGGRGAEGNEDPYYRFGDFHACPDVLLDGRDGRAAAASYAAGMDGMFNLALTELLLTLPIVIINRKYYINGFKTLLHRARRWTRLSPLARVRRLCTAFMR